MDPKTSTTKPLLWLVGLFLLAGLIGLGAYTYSQRSGGGGGNANMPANANQDVNTSVMVNTTGSNTNAPANAIDTTPWVDYTNTEAGYSIRFPATWERVPEANGTTNTFTPTSAADAGCSLKVNWGGLLGRGTELQRGPDEKIEVVGESVTKRTWLGSDGDLVYFNFVLQHYLGVEGSIGSETSNCRQILDEIVDSLTLLWSTYRNDEYGYSFEYPSALTVQNYTTANAFRYNSKLRQQIIVPRAEGQPHIVMEFVDDTATAAKSYLEGVEKLGTWEARTLNGKSVEVAKEPLSAAGSYHYFYVGEHRGKVFVLSTYTEADASRVTFY